MRVPPFERFAKFTQAVAFVVLGAIIGAMAYHAVFFMNFNALQITNTALEDKLADYEDRLQKLVQFKDQHTVVKSILPTLLDRKEGEAGEGPDERTRVELKSKLKKDLSVFLGTSIYKIDSNAELARLLLDSKIYVLESGKEYKVSIHTMLVVDNVLQVWFSAVPYERPLN